MKFLDSDTKAFSYRGGAKRWWGFVDSMFTPKVLIRIALFALVAESLSLWMLSLVPLDIGFLPGVNPWFRFFGRLAVLVHLPAVDWLSFLWNTAGRRVWWLAAFIVGYVEIVLAAAVVYSGVVMGRRSALLHKTSR